MADSHFSRRYLMVLSVPALRIDAHCFAIESAFAKHLFALKLKLGDLADRLVLTGPEFDAQATVDPSLSTIRSEDGIDFCPAFPETTGRWGYLLRLPQTLSRLWHEVRQADIVHAGPSHPQRLFEFAAIVMAVWLRKRTVYVTDIDHRRSPQMLYQTGAWSRRQYWTAKWIWGPAIHLQHLFAARFCSLVLLKGARLAADYGRGRPNVKNFINAAFDETMLVEPAQMVKKVAESAQGPLKLIYFGRLEARKGVDHMLRAVRRVVDSGLPIRFDVIGDGAQRDELLALTRSLGLGEQVKFSPALPYGELLFTRLREAHVLLAAPLSEDTPRSALDALASGLALVAYDTYYYRDLAEDGAPVLVVPWLDDVALGETLVQLARDRHLLADLLRRTRDYAETNTQDKWLDRRVDWTRQMAA